MACGEICRPFSYRGLKPRIFFEWDVGRKPHPSEGIHFFMALPPRTRWECRTIVEEMKDAFFLSESKKIGGEISFEQ